MDQTDFRLPLYQRLRDDVAKQIAGNVWRPGAAIPTEAELAASHNVAVGTVRKALDLLVADGLVERRQGRGTFVRRPEFDSSLFRFFRYHGPDGARTVPEGRILTREAVAASPDARAGLRLAKDSKAIRLTRLRLIAGAPVLSEEIWLPLRRFAPLLDVDPGDIGDLLYPAYERICGEIIARAEETVTVDTAGDADVQALGLQPGQPVVVIERLAFSYDDHPVEWRRTRGPATDFRYHVEIR